MSDNLSSHTADQYDAEVAKTIPFYEEIHNQVIDLVKTYNPQVTSWLDTGCGTGTFVKKAISEFQGCSFFLNDPSEKMLEICKAKLKGEKIKILGCHTTDEIKLDDNSLDVITAIQSHHYLNREERAQSTLKCLSLLKQGGIYITFENVRPHSNETVKIGLERWEKFQLSIGKKPEDIRNHLKRFDTEFFPITVTEHLKLLYDTGFFTNEVFWLSYMQAGFYAIK